MWQEKVKTRWLEEGDVNTQFFHLSIVVHRKHNFIHYILGSDNCRIEIYDLIALNFTDYYSNLFATVSPSFPSDFQGLIQPSINNAMNQTSITIPSIYEVYKKQ